ncbi:MAG: serine/threonine protein kinase, partial [Planktothrix sp.]
KNNVFFEIQRLQRIYNNQNDSCETETAQLSIIYHSKKRTIFKPLNPGEVIGEFEIIKSLGKGAFGSVYLAMPVMNKNIKLVLKFTAGSHNEIEILRSLNHSHIMPVLEHQPPRDLQAIIMPYLGELTLMDFIYDKAQGKNKNENHKDINFDNSMGITRLKYQWISKLASAVGHIHEKGYIHRDLKPANVLISFQNEPILIDFNMAIKVESQHVTHHGGTLAYMAPEQLCERCGLLPESTFSTDIYSLGLIITELLTGALPFPARSGELRKIIPLMRMDRQKSK